VSLTNLSFINQVLNNSPSGNYLYCASCLPLVTPLSICICLSIFRRCICCLLLCIPLFTFFFIITTQLSICSFRVLSYSLLPSLPLPSHYAVIVPLVCLGPVFRMLFEPNTPLMFDYNHVHQRPAPLRT